jgi:recombination protein RecR
MSRYPSELLTLMGFLKQLPGVGARTAERFAFQLLTWQPGQLHLFAELLGSLHDKIKHCQACGCLIDGSDCHFCDKDKRDGTILCIISSAKDALSLENTRAYKGLYHVIGGLLSPLDGRSLEQLGLEQLQERLASLEVKEIIIALDSTLEGDATSLYLKEQLEKWGFSASRLAFGLPLGSSLDFVDGGTLSKALTGRQRF